MYTIYGIPNCNTIKKALTQLDNQGVAYTFVNFKKSPPTKTALKRWKAALKDWPVNKKGPTFRKIKDEFETADASEKLDLLIQNSSAIKRPIVEKDGKFITIGHSEEVYQDL